jgi:hypothetical protein
MTAPKGLILAVEDDENDAFFLKRAFVRTVPSLNLIILSDGEQAFEYLSGTGKYSERS